MTAVTSKTEGGGTAEARFSAASTITERIAEIKGMGPMKLRQVSGYHCSREAVSRILLKIIKNIVKEAHKVTGCDYTSEETICHQRFCVCISAVERYESFLTTKDENFLQMVGVLHTNHVLTSYSQPFLVNCGKHLPVSMGYRWLITAWKQALAHCREFLPTIMRIVMDRVVLSAYLAGEAVPDDVIAEIGMLIGEVIFAHQMQYSLPHSEAITIILSKMRNPSLNVTELVNRHKSGKKQFSNGEATTEVA